MKTLLLVMAAASGLLACGNKCTPGPSGEPPQCIPLADAGSANCDAGQACVPILGTPNANDNRCFVQCSAGRCSEPGYFCQPYGVGSNCANPKEGGLPGTDQDDGGVINIDCHTVFVCMPVFCQ